MMAANMFAKLIKLIPLDSSEVKVEAWPQDLQALRAKEKVFIDELMNLKNVQDFRLPVKINADLRSYQADGIKWLAFLNRYKLHGILCDDMGLGKTLQAICILASDHFSRSNNSKLRFALVSRKKSSVFNYSNFSASRMAARVLRW